MVLLCKGPAGQNPFMEDTKDLVDYLEKICYPVEWDLLGYPVRNKKRLISAIISNALINEHPGFEQLKKIPVDKSLINHRRFYPGLCYHR